MKIFIFLCIMSILACKQNQTKSVDITPKPDSKRDSVWKVNSNGTADKVPTNTVYIIIGQELLPSGNLYPDTIRRVVNKPYNIGDTVFIEYERRWIVVQQIEK